MGHQIIKTPGGEELVVLPRAEYDAMRAALDDAREDAEEIAIYDARKAELSKPDSRLPATVSAAMLRGASLVTALRKHRGMKQIELAEKAGLSQGYLSDLESGRRKGSQDVLEAVAKALDVPAVWLVP